MAQLTKNKLISGAIGNVVFRNVGNKQILVSKSGPIKQTALTKASGSEFRQCSSWGSWLRSGLASFINKQADAYMHSRFAGQLYSALQTNSTLPKGERTLLNSDLSTLKGFEFNTHSPFVDYCIPRLTADLNELNQVVVTLPELNPIKDIRFVKGSSRAELLIYVLATNFDTNTPYTDGFTLLSLEKSEGTLSETVWIGPVIPAGHLVLVCAKLLFYTTNKFTEKNYVNSKECNPAQVIMAR